MSKHDTWNEGHYFNLTWRQINLKRPLQERTSTLLSGEGEGNLINRKMFCLWNILLKWSLVLYFKRKLVNWDGTHQGWWWSNSQSDEDKLDRSISSVHRGKRMSLANATQVICSGTSLVASHVSKWKITLQLRAWWKKIIFCRNGVKGFGNNETLFYQCWT